MKGLLTRLFKKDARFRSAEYWESRYQRGGNSGDGSYGRLSVFKAGFINNFIRENSIKTTIEFGCGDGHQLSMINYQQYLGLDVSEAVINNCAEKFKGDDRKSFMLYKGDSYYNRGFIQADLCVSLDVIYHIVEEPQYRKYLEDLFATSSKYVIIYSTNFDKNETVHVLHRSFLKYVQENISSFEFIKEVLNEYPGTGEQESEANFYIFKNRG